MQNYSKYRIPTACGNSPACGGPRYNYKATDCGIPPYRPMCGINTSIKKAA